MSSTDAHATADRPAVEASAASAGTVYGPGGHRPAATGGVQQPIVTVRNLCHFFGEGAARNQVLFDNELDVFAGEIIIMTGPSGSGKTTLLTLIGGLRSIQEGSVNVLGRELRGLSSEQLVDVRLNIGFIFQAHNLFRSLTAHQNVKMALELIDASAAQRQKRATEILTQLGLGHRLHYKPDSLSGGQKQRVAIARALANRPRLILADEPTAALDEKSGREVVSLLQKLAREDGCTSLLVTHDNRILDVADRIVNMVGGHIQSDVRVGEAVTVCEFLGKCPSFAGLTLETLSALADKMALEKYPAGTIIFRQGDEGDRFYLIRAGSVDIMRDERGTVLATLKPGEFFGEVALLTGEKRNATARVRDNLEAYTLSKADFHAAIEHSPTFKEQLLKVYFVRQ
jgi:putative ABC transport system ATP-binding protein